MLVHIASPATPRSMHHTIYVPNFAVWGEMSSSLPTMSSPFRSIFHDDPLNTQNLKFFLIYRILYNYKSKSVNLNQMMDKLFPPPCLNIGFQFSQFPIEYWPMFALILQRDFGDHRHEGVAPYHASIYYSYTSPFQDGEIMLKHIKTMFDSEIPMFHH